ncbi:hypothetical protein [Desulfosporosinus hippei]|uniref:Uncharacterized protein n=1 Tax=Desulfosporosinus hippei DSM 8344 TaxID=1121419 RepID=A0A1G7TKW7_9FIRM|nr:hypothetical protein [Desulfosporosinus hippei]SDG35742.1 hypothetical protein SAMN05443529_102267 [Desulfosporosinus hippei DSM 8344]
MNDSDNKTLVHPGFRRILLTNPTEESLNTIIQYELFDQITPPLKEDILCLLPAWEQQASDGNEVLAALILHMTQKTHNFMANEKMIQSNLLRIRILASTPGCISFPILEVQEHLGQFLKSADILADLPEFNVVSFSASEIKPLSTDLTRFALAPHSRRYIQNLFYSERCEAILSVLAHIAKNYPILSICRQAYALMLSLDNLDTWGNHPFCVRLIANRFWDTKLKKLAKA